jgi:2-polyprenyl-6-methoxyphenol hydroxylase-like FAD-dependent oxidoreductase
VLFSPQVKARIYRHKTKQNKILIFEISALISNSPLFFCHHGIERIIEPIKTTIRMKHPALSFLLFAFATLIFNCLFWNSKAYAAIDAYRNTKPTNAMNDPQQQQEQPTVVICGGGPGGLLASVLLNNIGIKSTIVEQAVETSPWGIKSYSIILNEKGKDSLERGKCLEAAIEAGQERKFTVIFNPTTGETKGLPKIPPNLSITRHLLVQCIERIAVGLPHVTFRKGVGVSGVVSENGATDLRIDLKDGTSIHATHVIGADGKWSNVRRSHPSFSSTMVTCPSSAVHMTMAGIPEGWDSNGTYILKPTNEECKFYIIASALPDDCEMSITMVYFDQALEKYPWLEPPESATPKNYNEGWNNGETETIPNAENSKLAHHMKTLFEEELPAFSALLDDEVYRTAVVRRRATWLQMEAQDGKAVTYSSNDGRVSLIGDAAHAMTASIGEGCNTALDSAVKLVDSIVETMKEKDETSCTTNTLSLAFKRYGSSRPKECISIQELSASRSTLKN